MIDNHILLIVTATFLTISCTSSNDDVMNTALNSNIKYKCEHGEKIDVKYFTTKDRTHHALISIDNKKYDLKSVPSASGAKYSDGKSTWWAKGTSGFFEINDAITVKNCVEQ